MKYKFLSLLFTFSLVYQSGYSQWYKNKFVIGSFADPRVFGVTRDDNPAKDSISFTLAKGAYINLLSGPQFYNGSQDFRIMDKTLDLASKYNMHVMVVDSKLSVTKDDFSDKDANKILAHFKSVDTKKREALGGYSFGGEFPIAKSAKVKKWAGYFNNNDSHRPAYTYLLPSYGFNSRNAYENYLNSYLDDKDPNNRLEIVAYDYYPFLSPEFMSSYFYNLGIIKEKAGDRPVWYFIQSTIKKGLPDITDYQLKFMAYCPLAYGAKGALYYTYESVPAKLGLNYYDAIIDPAGNPTPKYNKVRTINYFITNIAGPIIMNNTWMGAYHVSNRPTNENIANKFVLSKNNRYVASISNENILVGVFKEIGSTRYYLMLVNKSPNTVSDIKISVPGRKSIIAFPESFNYHGGKDKPRLSVNTDKNGKLSNFNVANIHGGEMTILEVD